MTGEFLLRGFAELSCMSNFSFLRGASHPEELVVVAKKLGLSGLALSDRNSVAGVVRAHMAAKEAGLAFQPGCRLVFGDGTPDCLVWPKNIEGWNNLCRLLSHGNLRARKGDCYLELEDLEAFGQQMAIGIVPQVTIPKKSDDILSSTIMRLSQLFPKSVWLVISNHYQALGNRQIVNWTNIAKKTNTQLLASNHVLYHRSERRMLQDVVTCIREHVTLEKAGYLVNANAERYLKSYDEMRAMFLRWPEAAQSVDESLNLFSQLKFSLDELRYQYPDEAPSSNLSPQQELTRLTDIGAKGRYPKGVPIKIQQQIIHELELINELQYAPYFLTVYDIVRFARLQDILCQGRGSAANSTVCYCIGITDVDPSLSDLLFERFISPERKEPPDIDVDFEHERREEVIQYIYQKYGREHSALAASVVTYRARSAVREIGKVFGLSEDAISALAGSIWGHSSSAMGEREVNEAGLDMGDKGLNQVLQLSHEINGFPRHLSQHVGGFVITRDRLDTIVPVMNTAMENRTQVEWDKDDLESLGILKIDILALGMLTCLRKAFDLLENHYDLPMDLATMPKEDQRTYAMIQRADTIGVFQIESRAQMSMLPRLKPASFYDLVIEVAIVRPGPIQGDMVHPYLRRRQGKEKVSYPSEELKEVLGRTLGVPLFQEQAMKIAIVGAGFSPGEADKLRRAMATFRRVGTIHTFQEKMVEGMAAKGYDREFAARCFRQIEGFGEYGFPESHAASFALLVYASCWLKCHYPDVFAAAIINSQPMGFYSPAQLVRDAREHGIEILPPDINLSNHDCTLEPLTDNKAAPIHPSNKDMKSDIYSKFVLRLGLRQIKGVGKTESELVMEMRHQVDSAESHTDKPAPYKNIRDFWLRTGLARSMIERFADADAFRSIGLDRRGALWAVRALDSLSQNSIAKTGKMPLFDQLNGNDPVNEVHTDLPMMPEGEHVIQDYRYLSLSLKAHPLSFLREDLKRSGLVTNRQLETIANGRWITIAGLIVVRQRPGSAKGVVFMTLEDETGIANIVVWSKVFEKYRSVVMASRFVKVRGKLQKADGVTHLVADFIEDASPLLIALTEEASVNAGTTKDTAIVSLGGIANADEVKQPVQEVNNRNLPGSRLRRLLKDVPDLRKDYQKLARNTDKVMPRGRNFH
ncbi:MAG: error-prone DNA polymerase [Hyphomicrobiales bacterium]|nr:error-prone DNA polymerase [Hyphomicrobiales bacterium]